MLIVHNHEYTLNEVPVNAVWYVPRELVAGPLRTEPFVAKLEP